MTDDTKALPRVVTGLIAKRAEIAGEIENLQGKLKAKVIELDVNSQEFVHSVLTEEAEVARLQNPRENGMNVHKIARHAGAGTSQSVGVSLKPQRPYRTYGPDACRPLRPQ